MADFEHVTVASVSSKSVPVGGWSWSRQLGRVLVLQSYWEPWWSLTSLLTLLLLASGGFVFFMSLFVRDHAEGKNTH